MMKHRVNPYENRKAVIAVFVLALYSTGCGNSSTQQSPNLTPQILASATQEHHSTVPAIASPTPRPSLTPFPPTVTLTPIPTSIWKAGWVDFINSYYGYAISIPSSAEVRKNDQVDSYDPQELPADWDPKEDYFDYLDMTYPPGLCTIIEHQSMFIQIAAPDSLGGRYSPECSSFGGLGVAHWVWSEQEVFVGETSFPATVLGQCDSDAPDAKCSTVSYGI